MEDLTLEDLKLLQGWGITVNGQAGFDPEERELAERIDARIEELEELNNLDLDDCAGGACKL